MFGHRERIPAGYFGFAPLAFRQLLSPVSCVLSTFLKWYRELLARMASPISLLYQPLISRELDGVPGAVAVFRRTHSSAELFEAVTRFAILAFTPSQHSRHSVLSCLAAYHLRADEKIEADELLIACARYAAQSRPPWSEPPITDPPRTEEGQRGDRAAIDAAIDAGDRLGAEKWLALRMREPRLEQELFEIAVMDLSDFGHKLIMTTAAVELSRLMGEKGAYATLRLAPVEWTAFREEPVETGTPRIEPRKLVENLIERLVSEKGDTIAFHALEMYDAALTAVNLGADPSVEVRVRAHLEELPAAAPAPDLEVVLDPPVYSLGRDYAEYLLATAIGRRMANRFPGIAAERIARAACYNLEHGPSFEDWSFA